MGGEGMRKVRNGTLTSKRSGAMKHTLSVAILLVTLSVLTTGLSAAAQETIGIVRTSEGKATVTRGGKVIPAEEGTKILVSPAEGKLGLMARLSKGTMAYLSGLIGKLAPESVRFETPTASIGVRGTHFAVKTGEFASQ